MSHATGHIIFTRVWIQPRYHIRAALYRSVRDAWARSPRVSDGQRFRQPSSHSTSATTVGFSARWKWFRFCHQKFQMFN
jgi:hypothetical protein